MVLASAIENFSLIFLRNYVNFILKIYALVVSQKFNTIGTSNYNSFFFFFKGLSLNGI